MGELKEKHALFCLVLLFLSGACIFLLGFFPLNLTPEDAAIAQRYKRPQQLDALRLHPIKRKYEQIILLIVDALRHDFATSDDMAFAKGMACDSLKLKANVPTVTMPRIKSLTTGTLSSFIDIILNLGESEQLSDSLLHRLQERGDIMLFAGDRIWFDLFPDKFARHKILSDTYYVLDFIECDKNITEMLQKELHHTDWSFFILHYLGLDHIGHVEGSDSNKVPIKLKEMDQLVQQVVYNQHFSNRLLLLSADHGMRKGGGHGGSTAEEIFVPLMTFKQNCSNKNINDFEYQQIDLTPTLAMLFGVEIPHTSIGCLLPELLNDFSWEDQLYAYYYNAKHLMLKAISKFAKSEIQQSDYYSWYKEAKESHKVFLETKVASKNAKSTYSFQNAKLNYMRVCKEISSNLAATLVTFEYEKIAVGMILMCLSTILTCIVVFFVPSNWTAVFSQSKTFYAAFVLTVFTNLGYGYFSSTTSGSMFRLLLTLPIFNSYLLLIGICRSLQIVLKPWRNYKFSNLKVPLPLMFCLIFHTCSLASSSFVEEEHQTWYYLVSTLLVLLCAKNVYRQMQESAYAPNKLYVILSTIWRMRSALVMLCSILLLRRLNQGGDKWKQLQDIGDILNREENHFWLKLLFFAGLLLLFCLLRQHCDAVEQYISAMALFCLFWYRNLELNYGNAPTALLFIFMLCLISIAALRYRTVAIQKELPDYQSKYNIVALLKTNMSCSLLFGVLLQKPHNVVLLPALNFMLQQAYQLCDNLKLKGSMQSRHSYILVFKTLLTVFIAKMFYFYQGNSNSLATIDLKPGFIGQSSYNPLMVGIFVFYNTYSAYINAMLFLMLHVFKQQLQLLPKREQGAHSMFMANTEKDMETVVWLYAVANMLPVCVFYCILILLRFHLFIYSVFAPKALYIYADVFVFFLNYIYTQLFISALV